jgi:hypothetical protein
MQASGQQEANQRKNGLFVLPQFLYISYAKFLCLINIKFIHENISAAISSKT